MFDHDQAISPIMPPRGRAMRIVAIADTHLAARATACLDNWFVVHRWIRNARPDLVVHLGDISVDGATDAAELRQAASAFTGLQAAIRFLPGNHDIGDNPCAPGAHVEHPLDRARLEEYRVLFGADRWALSIGSWRLIGLNAQLFGTGTPEEEAQFAWIEDVVHSHAGPIGLMLHKPLFRTGAEDDEPHTRYVPAAPRRRLLALLSKGNLRFVLSGHTHQSRRLVSEGVEHRWVPSTAFCLPDGVQERIGEKQVGLLLLWLHETTHRAAVVSPAGLHRHSILDLPVLYPGLAELRTRLGAAAAL